MNKELDKEYLSRPVIETTYRITDNEVYVVSEKGCTSYANIHKLERILKEDVLNLYSEVIKMAKAKGVKISYKNHYKRKINENWERYRDELIYYNDVFDKTRDKFKEVEKRGLHSGTTDDIVLREALDLRNEYIKCYWRTSTLSLIHGIYNDLQKHHRELQSPYCNYYMIYL